MAAPLQATQRAEPCDRTATIALVQSRPLSHFQKHREHPPPPDHSLFVRSPPFFVPRVQHKYSYAIVDGHLEKVGNYNVEPPGLFRGRGKHPKTGMLKARVMPSDIALICAGRVCAAMGFHMYHGITGLSRIPHKTAGKIPRNAPIFLFVFLPLYDLRPLFSLPPTRGYVCVLHVPVLSFFLLIFNPGEMQALLLLCSH